ncbi:MAG TPA: hypothetical protein DHV24_02615 [Candidatus Margulisbacteria bacterium]|nr:hypothetical protein [Candidatus Margulisiibacteriota bacterium]
MKMNLTRYKKTLFQVFFLLLLVSSSLCALERNIGDNKQNEFEQGIFYNTRPYNTVDGEIGLFARGNIDPSWVQESSDIIKIPQPLTGHRAFFHNKRMYVAGGNNGTVTNKIYFWGIDTDGTLTGYQETQQLNEPLENFAVVNYNSYVYTIGGYNGSAISDIVNYAKIDANGDINSFQSSTNKLPVALQDHGAVFYKGKIFVVGGSTNSGFNSNIYATTVNVTGSIQSWQTVKTDNRLGNASIGIGVSGRYMYIVGGIDGGGVSNQVLKYNMETNVLTAMATLPLAREKASLVINKGNIYVVCGKNSTDKNSVYVASIDSNGDINAWTTASNFPLSGSNFASIPYESDNSSFIYSFISNNGKLDIYYGNIEGNYILDTFTSNGLYNMPDPLRDQSVVSTGNYLYTLGGYGDTYKNKILMTTKNISDGSIMPWKEIGTLPIPMDSFSATIIGSRMYVLGGINDAGRTSRNYVITINASTGELVNTWNEMAQFPNPLANHSAVCIKDTLYVIGGSTSTQSCISQVLVGTITSTGSINSWTVTKSLDAVSRHSTAVLGDYILVLGGQTGDGISNKVRYIQFDAQGKLSGEWQVDNTSKYLPYPVKDFSCEVYNNTLYVFGGNDGGAGRDGIVYLSLDGAVLGSWKTASNKMPGRIFEYDTAVLGSYLYVIGGMLNSTVVSSVYRAKFDSSIVYNSEGSFVSRVIDIGSVVSVNALNWASQGNNLSLSYDIAGDDGLWAGFSPFISGTQIAGISKLGRYLRYMAVVTANQVTVNSLLTSALFNYQAPLVSIQVVDTTPALVTQNTKSVVASFNIRTDASDGYWTKLNLWILSGYDHIGTINVLDKDMNVLATKTNVGPYNEIVIPTININSTATRNYLLAFDIKPRATVSESIQYKIEPTGFYFKAPAITSFLEFTSRADSQISRYIPVLQVQLLSPDSKPGYVGFPGPAGWLNHIHEGESFSNVGKILLSNDLNTSNMSTLKLEFSGTSINRDVDKVYLYKDKGNGVYDYNYVINPEAGVSPDETLIASADVSEGVVILDLTSCIVTVDEQIATYFIVIDCPDSKRNSTINISCNDSSYFTVVATPSGLAASVNVSNMPLNSRTFAITAVLSKVQLVFTDTLQSAATQDAEIPVMKLEMNALPSYAKVATISIDIPSDIGYVTSKDIEEISIWKEINTLDWNKDKDLKVGAATFPFPANDKRYSISVPDMIVESATNTWYVVVKLSPAAYPGRLLKFSIPDDGWSWVQGEGAWDQVSPLPLGNITAQNLVTPNPTDECFMPANTAIQLIAPINVTQDREVDLFNFTLNTGSGAFVVNTMNFEVFGTHPTSDIDYLTLSYVKSNGVTENIAIASVLDNQYMNNSGLCTISLSEFMVIKDSLVTFNVKAKINPNASVNSTFNVSLDTESIPGGIMLRPADEDKFDGRIRVTSNILTIVKHDSIVSVAPIIYPYAVPSTNIEKNNEYLFQSFKIKNTSIYNSFFYGLRISITGNESEINVATANVYKNNQLIGSAPCPVNSSVTVNFNSVQVLDETWTNYSIKFVIDDNSRDYTNIGSSISQNSFILDPQAYFSGNFGLLGSQVATIDPKPSTLNIIASSINSRSPQGSNNVAVMRLIMAMDTGESHWTTLNIHSTGDAFPTRNISSAKIFRDSNDDNICSPDIDVLLSNSYAFDNNGMVTVSLNVPEHITTTNNGYFILFDIKGDATPGVTQGVEVVGVGLRDIRDKVSANYPVVNPLSGVGIDVAEIIVSVKTTDFLSLNYPSVFSLNSSNNVMLRIEMGAKPKAFAWESFRVNIKGTATGDDIKSIKIYKDEKNQNNLFGFFETASDTLISEKNVLAGVPYVDIINVDSVYRQIPYGSTVNYFAVISFEENATPNNTVSINISGVEVLAPGAVVQVNEWQSTLAIIDSSTVSIKVNQYESGSNLVLPNERDVAQGAHSEFFKLKLKTDVSYCNLHSVTISMQTDGAEYANSEYTNVNDIFAIKIVKDGNNPDNYSELEDTQIIATFNPTSGLEWNIPLSVPVMISKTDSIYWIVAAVSSNATPRRYLSLKITSANFELDRAAKTSMLPSTVITPTMNGKIIDPPSILEVFESGNKITGTVKQGEKVHVLYAGVRVNNQYETSLASLLIKLDGTIFPSDIKAIEVYKDVIGDSKILAKTPTGGIAEQLLGIASITDIAAPVQVDFTNVENGLITITSNPTYIHVVAVIDNIAEINHQSIFTITNNSFILANDSLFSDQVTSNAILIQSDNLAIEASSDTLNVIFNNYLTQEYIVTSDSKLNKLTAISLRASSNSVVLEKLELEVTGNYNSNDFSAFYLYEDTNLNSTYDVQDERIATSTINDNSVEFVFPDEMIQGTEHGMIVTDVLTRNYFVLFDVARHASANHYVKIISSKDNLYLSRTDDQDKIEMGNFSAATINIIEATDMLTVSINDYTLNEDYVFYRGDRFVPISKLTLSANQHETYFQAIHFQLNAGNDVPGEFLDLKRFAVYKENSGNNAFDSGKDYFVGEVRFQVSSIEKQEATITFSAAEVIGTQPVVYYFVVDLEKDLAPIGITGNLGFTISTSDFKVSSPDIVSFSGAFYNGFHSINELPKQLYVNDVGSLAPHEAGTGTTFNIMEKLLLSSNHESITLNWNSLIVRVNGTLKDSEITSIHIIRDNPNTGSIGVCDLGDSEVTVNTYKNGKIFELTFDNAEVMTGTSNWYFLAVDVHPSANIGNKFQLRVESADSYGVDNGTIVRVDNAVFETDYSTISIPRNYVTVFFSDVVSKNLYQAEEKAIGAVLSLSTNGKQINWESIKLDKLGTLDERKIKQINVYKDINNNKRLDLTGDVVDMKITVGQIYTINEGSVLMNFGAYKQILNSTTQNYLVICDLADDLIPGSSLGFSIAGPDSLSGMSADEEVVNISGNIIQAPILSKILTVEASMDTLLVVMHGLQNAEFIPGSRNVTLASVEMATDRNFVDISTIQFSKGGSLDLSNIECIKLYRDDGSGNSGQLVISSNSIISDKLIASVNTSVQGSSTIINLPFAVKERIRTTSINYLIVVDIAEVDRSNETFSLSLSAPSSITPDEPSDNVTGEFPSACGPYSLVNTNDKLYMFQYPVAVTRNVAQEASNYVIETFGLKTSIRYASIAQEIVFKKTGTLDSQYIKNVQIYRDDNSDCIFNPSTNTKVSTQLINTFNGSGWAVIPIELQLLHSSTVNYFVVVDIDPNAPKGQTLGIEVQNSDLFKTFNVLPPDTIANETFNWEPHLINIVRYQTTTQFSFATSVNQSISVINEFELCRLYLQTFHNTSSLKGLILNLNGEINPISISKLNIYKETGIVDGFDDTDELYNSSFASYENYLVATGNTEITSDKESLYYVLIKLDENNTTTNTLFSVQLSPTLDVMLNEEAMIFTTANCILITANTLDERQPKRPTINFSPFINKTNQLSFSFESFALNGVKNVKYAIGTMPGIADIVDWKIIDLSTLHSVHANTVTDNAVTSNIVVDNITLIPGQGYYIAFQVMSSEGLWSELSISDKILVDLSPPSIPGRPFAQLSSSTANIIISWGSSNDSESGIAKYYLQMKKGSASEWQLINVSNQTSYIVVPSYNFDTYYFRVKVENNAGDMSGYSEESAGITYGPDKPSALLSDVINYPNPFYPDKEKTFISYVLNAPAEVVIKIYDLFGNLVKDLSFSPGGPGGTEGYNIIEWSGKNIFENVVAKGGYIAIIRAKADSKEIQIIRKIGVIR